MFQTTITKPETRYMDTISGFWKNFICFRFRFSKRVAEYQFLFAMMFETFDIWTVSAWIFWIFAFIIGYCLPPDMKGIFSSFWESFYLFAEQENARGRQ